MSHQIEEHIDYCKYMARPVVALASRDVVI